MKDIGEILTGSTPSTSQEDYYCSDGTLWVTPTDIDSNIIKNTARKLSIKGEKVARIVPKNTILVTCIASIGKNALVLEKSSFNQQINSLTPFDKYNPYFLLTDSVLWSSKMKQQGAAGMMQIVNKNEFSEIETNIPSEEEQNKIGELYKQIDNLITLHQRYKNRRKGVDKMDTYDGNELFYKYYERWVNVYKEGAIRKSTMQKYNLSLKWLKKLAPKLKLKEVNRITYQEILNGYAEKHERQSTMDFHHQIKASVLDAVDDGYIEKDPTRKAIIKGRTPVREKKEKYLNQFELQKLISDLDLKNSINSDWLIYLIAKTGLRFSEALAITPKDFDFPHQILNVDKTWNYKDNTGFEATKNKSSERKVQLDWQTVIQFSELVKDLDPSSPIFINDRIYNSTINDLLARHCKRVEIPVISIHGLRHTHASLLLYAGVSVASVAHRLGHASMTTTQKIYLHIIQELENTDIDKIMRALTSLNS